MNPLVPCAAQLDTFSVAVVNIAAAVRQRDVSAYSGVQLWD
jgi:hypothetical protein